MFTQQQVLPTDASKSKKNRSQISCVFEKKKKFKNLVNTGHLPFSFPFTQGALCVVESTM